MMLLKNTSLPGVWWLNINKSVHTQSTHLFNLHQFQPSLTVTVHRIRILPDKNSFQGENSIFFYGFMVLDLFLQVGGNLSRMTLENFVTRGFDW